MAARPCVPPFTIRRGSRLIGAGSHAGKLVVMAADHRGFRLKELLKKALRRRGWRVKDVGTRSVRRVDYPVYAARAARIVGKTQGRKAVGVAVCGSSIGMCVAAGKVRGVIPANPRSVAVARLTRTHNNSNYLSLSAAAMRSRAAFAVTLAWLAEPFYTDPVRHRNYLRRYLQTVALEPAPRRRAR